MINHSDPIRTSQNLLEGLNTSQKEAVIATEGPVQVMAGAGSGKTRVLTHRIAYILAEKKCQPWNILAITFTNKAAREMKNRVVATVGPDANDIWISTFHSMCMQILRREIDKLGKTYTSSFTILDTSDQLTVIKQILKEENLDPKKFEPRKLLYRISQAKNILHTPTEMKKGVQGFFEEVAAEVYVKYQRRLELNNCLDFDDLLMLTVQLFNQVPDVEAFYQNKFQYIHVDEYQDTNHAQYILVKKLAAHYENICVVGDSDQSIYQFRGADISNILNFERDYPRAKMIKLEQNYRSTKKILEAANCVIRNNAERKPKELWTDNDEGSSIQLFEADTEFEEALFIADKIIKAHEQGCAYNAHVVLYRTNVQSRVIEDVMVKANIPYQMVGGVKFYDRKEIKDVLAYLRLIVNVNDDISLRRIINVPKRGIGPATMDKIAFYAEHHEMSCFFALLEVEHIGLSKRVTDDLQNFVSFIQQMHAMKDYLSASELIEEVLQRSGYRQELKRENTLEAEGRLENINELLTVAQEFEVRHEDKSLLSFLTELALVADLDQLDKEDGPVDAVTLMTLHSAKGLEFPYVFLVGLEEGIFPHVRSMKDEKDIEEERRLAYVGITRAEKQLHLLRAVTRTIFGQVSNNLPSRFLKEIPEGLVENCSKHKGRREQQHRPIVSSYRVETKVVDWTAGDQAEHKKWGIGTVLRVDGQGEETELKISFPAPYGEKRLLAKYAPIQKVEGV